MIEVKVITNNNISEEAIIDICKIKSVFGEYSFDSQRQWIIDNIKPDDIHFLIYDNNKLIAYANLIEESLFMDEKEINILGLGNVCVDEKGKEKGYLLMSKINNYLIENNRVGLLFCKSMLVPFYDRNNWKSIKPDYSENICWMSFNAKGIDMKNISYRRKLF